MSVNPKNTLSVDACTTPRDIEILGVPDYEIPDYILTDNKQYMKYLFAIEKECRRSFEYKQFMRFLKDNCGMDRDSFLENVTIDNGAKIEIHHSPLTLFDIVSTVVNKRTEANESLSIPMVAKEVMYQHYCMNVGLIPLAETVHELVHNQYLFIPSTKVYGNWKRFVMEYKQWMPGECIDALERIEQLTTTYEADEYQQVLSRKYIYVDASGSYNLPKLEDIQAMVKGHIREIMENPQEPREAPKSEERQYHSPIIFDN